VHVANYGTAAWCCEATLAGVGVDHLIHQRSDCIGQMQSLLAAVASVVRAGHLRGTTVGGCQARQ
jgi:hypothetical protein